MESFSQLGLAEPLATALASFGFAGPTRVQAEAIPILLSRRDAIIESETGTGKTFAYLAPALQMASTLELRQGGEPGVIVASPTQELAVQIGREAEKLSKAAGLQARIAVLLGGTPLEKQAAKLRDKPAIVVGTLGRLADLIALRKLKTSSLKLLVLDEADRLFSNETEDMARALLSGAPPSCVRVLVSATMPERSRREAGPYLRNPAEISPAAEGVLSGDIEHWCFYCDGRKRLDFARRFEAAVHPERCLLFLSAASRIEKAALALAKLGLPIEAIHAGVDKESRRVALERFAEGKVRYLLTSDLGARGLDIPGVTHVLSLDLPEEPTIYTHRAGRTGRAGAKGVSVALADGVELARASKLAVRGGFSFRCKVLEGGEIVEPTTEEFFDRASEAEAERMAHKASRVADGARRGGAKRPVSGDARRTGDRRTAEGNGARRPATERGPVARRAADAGGPGTRRTAEPSRAPKRESYEGRGSDTRKTAEPGRPPKRDADRTAERRGPVVRRAADEGAPASRRTAEGRGPGYGGSRGPAASGAAKSRDPDAKRPYPSGASKRGPGDSRRGPGDSRRGPGYGGSRGPGPGGRGPTKARRTPGTGDKRDD